MTVESLMEKISSASEIDKQTLLQDLENLKNGQEISVTSEEIISQLRAENENARYALDEDGSAQETCKWYEHETELKSFSKKHPQWLFILEGSGEESDDMWKKYFLNGKVQVAKAIVTFEPFDKNKLKA